MEKFKLFLLGSFYIDRLERPRPSLRRKTRALLAYLAATNEPHSRQQLINLFCAESNDPSAVLRSLLSRLRRNLDPDILVTEGETIRLNEDVCWIDHQEFFHIVSDQLESASMDLLLPALALYREDFLADLNLVDAAEFDLWLLAERARCRSLYERGLATAVSQLTAAEDWDKAIIYAQKLVAVNPLLESGHGRLIWLYARLGQYEAAKAQYRQICNLLATELAVEPTEELQNIVADIQAGKIRPYVATPVQTDGLAGAAVSSPTSLIGRDDEVALLNSAWKSAQSKHGRVLLVEAEAGCGKTYLVHSFGRQLPANEYLYGEAYETAQNIPYAPWLELLERALSRYSEAQLKELPVPVRAAIAQLVPSQNALIKQYSSLPTERLFAGLAAFLLADRPRLLFLDNLQWADSASLELFHFLARRVEQSSVVLVGAYRSLTGQAPLLALVSDLQRQSISHLLLPYFDELDIEALLSEQWPKLSAGFRPHVAHMLKDATGGNALFLTEIIRELAPTTAVPDALPVPPSVLELVQRRLRRLATETQQVLEGLAVFHGPAAPDLIRQISGRSEDETILAFDDAWRKGLILPYDEAGAGADRYDFHHDLIREAIVMQLSPLRRRLLHKRAATAMTNADAATLAYHWGMAGDVEQEGGYALLAGLDAMRLYAMDEAQSFFTRALSCGISPEQQIEIYQDLGIVYMRIGEWEKGIQTLESGLTLSIERADVSSEANFRLLMGQLYARQSHYDLALPHLQTAHDLSLSCGQQKTMAESIGIIGVVHWLRDEFEQSLACFQEALALSQEIGDIENISSWSGNIANYYHLNREYDKALAYYEKGLAVDKEINQKENYAVTLGNMGNVYQDLGDYKQAVAFHLQAATLRFEWGGRAGVAISLGDLAEDYREVGYFAWAWKCLYQALTLDVELGRRDACALLLVKGARMMVFQKEDGLALQVLEVALKLLKLTQTKLTYCQLLLEKGRILWRQNKIKEVAPLLVEVQSLLPDVRHQELLFDAEVMLILQEVKLNHQPLADAVSNLKNLLDEEIKLWQTAVIAYEIWRLDPTQTAWQQTAAEHYFDLYQQVPKYRYRARYLELTGKNLPEPLRLPEPPQLVTPLADNLLDFFPYISPLLQE